MNNELMTVLTQYCDLQQEIKALRERIDQTQRAIEKLEEEGYVVSDSVKGTRQDGTIGSIKITGFPYPEYQSKKDLLRRRIAKLELFEIDLLEKMNIADDYIQKIEDSKLRQIFTLRYLDERELAWFGIAHIMNERYKKREKKYTGDSCRMLHNRYLGLGV